METMNIALSAEMKEFVQTEAARGGYSSVSEYIRSLIREKQRREEEIRLENLLLKGLNSGPSTEMTKKDWEDLKRKIVGRFNQRRNR
ncbi:MAG: type II toxin-antitoxin system ParD family antitoxin [Candidatus Omnitrophota bacterium]